MKTSELNEIAYIADETAKSSTPIQSSLKKGEVVEITFSKEEGIFKTAEMVSTYTPEQWAKRETRFVEAEIRDAIDGYVDFKYYNPETKGWESKEPSNWAVCKVIRRYRRLGLSGGISTNTLIELSRYKRWLKPSQIPSDAIVFESFSDEKDLHTQFLQKAAEHYGEVEDLKIKLQLKDIIEGVEVKNRAGEVVFTQNVRIFTFA